MSKKIVSFQGLEGAYSDLVCRELFRDYKTLPCETFQEALEAVDIGNAKFAIIPVENNNVIIMDANPLTVNIPNNAIIKFIIPNKNALEDIIKPM